MIRLSFKLQDAHGYPIPLVRAVKLRALMCRRSKTGFLQRIREHHIEEHHFVKVIAVRDTGTIFEGPQFVLLKDWLDPNKTILNAYWPPPSHSFPDPVAHLNPGYDVEVSASCTTQSRTAMHFVPPETTHEDVLATLADINHDPRVEAANKKLMRLAGRAHRDDKAYDQLLDTRNEYIKCHLLQGVHDRAKKRLNMN